MEEIISSAQNPKVKQVLALRDKHERDGSQRFIIEGYRELLRAIDAGWKIETLFVCPELFLGTNENSLILTAAQKGARIIHCTDKIFHKLSYRDRPDGLVAIAPQRHLKLEQLKGSFFVIAEAIEKPGNLGTILRSADAVGVDGLIICDRCTDIYNPNVVRASVGTLFTVPIVDVESKVAIEWLKSQQITILAATPHATRSFTEVDMTIPLAIAVGTEQLGLSNLWMQQATLQVRIPMHGTADSLNVAMATTLLLYEARRQRGLRS